MANEGTKITMGILLLVFGVIFLLANLGVWTFWGIQWYTVAFILLGIGKLCWKEKKK